MSVFSVIKRRNKRYNVQIESLSAAPEITKVDWAKIAVLEKMVGYCQERIEILKAIYDAVPNEEKTSPPVIDVDNN